MKANERKNFTKCKVSIFALAIAWLTTGMGYAQLPIYEVDTYQTPVSFRIENDYFPIHGKFQQFEGFMSENLDDPNTWIALAEFSVPKFSNMIFVSTKIVPFSTDHIKVHGVLTFRGREESITVELRLTLWTKKKEKILQPAIRKR